MIQYSLNTNSISKYHAIEYEDQLIHAKPRLGKRISNKRNRNELSKSAKKRLRESASWLMYLSKKRNVKIDGSFNIKKFSYAFITLKLPSKQMHSHAEIIKKPLNLFLTKLRKNHNLKNYIWKAEIQKNGNIHFHLLIDRCIHHMVIRRYWNFALKHLGYISAYRNARKNLTYEEYRYWRMQEGNPPEKSIKKAWDYGNKTNWNSPNSTDVKLIRNPEIAAAYVSKYLAKNEGESDETGIKADSRSELNGRLWFCSQSLSRLKKIKIPYNSKIDSIFRFLSNSKSTFKVTGEFFEVVFFRANEFGSNLNDYLQRIFLTHANMCSYPFPEKWPEAYLHHYRLISVND